MKTSMRKCLVCLMAIALTLTGLIGYTPVTLAGSAPSPEPSGTVMAAAATTSGQAIRLEAEDFDEGSSEFRVGDEDIGGLYDGQWICFQDVDLGSGYAKLDYRYKNGNEDPLQEQARIFLDSTTTGTAIGIIPYENTLDGEGSPSWNIWRTKTIDLTGANGIHDIYILFKSPSDYDWFEFREVIAENSLMLQAEGFDKGSFEAGESDTEIGGLTGESWICFEAVDLGNGFAQLEYRYAYPESNTGVQAKIYLDSRSSGRKIGEIPYGHTDGWADWKTDTIALTGGAGIHDLYIRFTGATNYDWFRFKQELPEKSITIEAEDFSSSANVTNNGTTIGGLYEASWICFENVDLEDGFRQLEYRYANGDGRTQSVEALIYLDDMADGALIGKIPFLKTGGWSNWAANTIELTGGRGVHDIYFKFLGPTDFDWFRLKEPLPEHKITLEAVNYDEADGISKVDQSIGGLADGSWIRYAAVDFGEEGYSKLTYSYANADASTREPLGEIVIDEKENGAVIATIPNLKTADWSAWETNTVDVGGAAGVHDVFVKFYDPSNYGYFEFSGYPEAEELPDVLTSSVTYLGVDSATQGKWKGKYGANGYVLFGYSPEVVPVPNQWQSVPLILYDVIKKPDYLNSYGADWPSGHVSVAPSTEDDNPWDKTLELPDGDDRKKYQAKAEGDDPKTFIFRLNDEEDHIFSMYTMEQYTLDLTIEDLSGNVLEHRIINMNTFPGYVSFMVRGSFRFIMRSGTNAYGHSGFFFDPPMAVPAPTVEISNLPARSIKLDWNNTDETSKIFVEKSLDAVNFAAIATLDAGIETYTDTNLKAGQEYVYRIRYNKGIDYSVASEPVSTVVPAMKPVILTMLSGDKTSDVNGQVSVSAKYEIEEAGERMPFAGKTVKFKLKGGHVGDGITLGQEIPEELGTAVTNMEGIAELTFTCNFAGDFEVVAESEYDDVNNLDTAVSAPAKLLVEESGWTEAPVIFKISDAVKPGKLFSINGYAMFDDSHLDIAIEKSLGTSPEEPSAGAIHPDIVQRDRNGYYVVAELPESAEPGVYNVWVKNQFGWSLPYKLNGVRLTNISERQAFEGLDIKVVGRNFDQTEFSGGKNLKIRLHDGTNSYELKVKDSNYYAADVTIERQPFGSYFVEVSNDGGVNWARLDNGQKLEILGKGEDPLGLGVSWADDFNWDNQKDVTDFGAKNDDQEDDTAAVQAAVETAAADPNGGVVYFPNGSYYIKQIMWPEGIVLLGESTRGVKLYYTGSGENFLNTKEGTPGYDKIPERQGVARLTLMLSNPEVRPDVFIWIGESWSSLTTRGDKRVANRLFVYEVNIDYPTDSRSAAEENNVGGQRGIGLEFIGYERMLIKNNHFVGFRAVPFINNVTYYLTFVNNYIEHTDGGIGVGSIYSVAENNVINTVHPEMNVESHGISSRSNAYIANNTIIGAGDHSNDANDGEAIFNECPNAYFNHGSVLRAMADSIIVAPYRDLIYPKVDNGKLAVVITDGCGMGQMRYVSEIKNYTIAFTEPFDVIPNSTSKFTLITENEKTTIINNTVIDNAKGIWLFGNAWDSVVADNTSIDSEGIFVWATEGTNGAVIDYYTRIARNDITGISRRSHHGGISFACSRFLDNPYDHISIYSNEVIDNNLYGDNTAVPRGMTEAGNYGSINFIAAASGAKDDLVGDITNIIIQDNKLSDLKNGVDLTKQDYGVIARGNTLDETVLKYIEHRDAANAMIDSPLTSAVNNTPATPSGVRIAGSTAEAVDLEWEASPDADHDEITYYVYRNMLNIARTTETAFNDTDWKADMEYTYYILAKDGKGGISAASETVSAKTPEITVTDIIVRGAGNANTITAKNGSLKMYAEILPEKAGNKLVTWSVENGTGSAEISTTGVLKAISDGTVTVRAVARDGSGVMGTCIITISGQSTEPDTPPSQEQERPEATGGIADGKGNVVVKLKATIKGNAAESKADADLLNRAFDKAAADDQGVKTVKLEITEAAGAKSYTLEFPADFFTDSPQSARQLEIITPFGTITVSDSMFKSADVGKAKTVSITITSVDPAALDKKLKEKIGDRPVIEITASIDGKAITWNNPDSPVRIAVDYTPSAEEITNPECIVVWNIDGTGRIQPVFPGRYDEASGKVIFETVHFSKFAVAYHFVTFSDVQNIEWARKQIEVVASRGIIQGTSAEKFGPGENITRAQFIDALVKTLGLAADYNSNFNDVEKTSLYYDSIGTAKKLGITDGTGGNQFDPDAGITRQDMATLVVRAMKAKKIFLAAGSDTELKRFSDRSSIAAYAAENMATLVKERILQGGDNMLDPKGNTSRAQASVVLYRVYHRGN